MSSDSEEIRRKIKGFYDAAAQDSDNKGNVTRDLFGIVEPEQYAQSILRASASAEEGIASAASGGRPAGAGGADGFAAGDVAQGADDGGSEQPRLWLGWRAKPVEKVRVRDSVVLQSYTSLTGAAQTEYPALNLYTAISRIRKFLNEGTGEDGCVWREPEKAEGTLEQGQASPAPRSSENVGDKRTRAHKPETQRYKPTSQSAKRSTPDTSGSRNPSASKKTCRHFQNAQSDGAGG